MNTRDKIITTLNECLSEVNGIKFCGIDNATRVVKINNAIVAAAKMIDELQEENDDLKKRIAEEAEKAQVE